MVISRLLHAEGFEWLHPVDEEDFERLRFDGRPLRDQWAPVAMKRIIRSSRGEKLLPCDMPQCSGGDMLFVNAAAKDALGDMLEAHGELLPLFCDGTPYWAFNATILIPALDQEESQVVRSNESGRVLLILKHAFHPEALGEVPIFKLSETPRGLIYVREGFVELVKSTSLVGLDFKRLWP